MDKGKVKVAKVKPVVEKPAVEKVVSKVVVVKPAVLERKPLPVIDKAEMEMKDLVKQILRLPNALELLYKLREKSKGEHYEFITKAINMKIKKGVDNVNKMKRN